MGAYKADEDVADGEFNHYDKAVFVSFDVEDIVLVAYIVGCGKACFDIRQIFPFCLFRNVIPPFQGDFCVAMSFLIIKLYQFSV